jgi:D-xylose 1-dehydrogenase (NADP+, D-xylono-1,5-lactone-forming)
VLGARAAGAPFEIVAVGSRDLERARTFAATWGIERAHGSYEELLADDGVDAVYIALPNALHHAWTLRALGAGKHVLCEKPYSRRPVEVEEAWSEAERRGLVLVEAFMWRHSTQTRLLQELLPRVGELQTVRATFSFRLDRGPDVRLVPELGGGSLLDVGCYCVSALRLVTGREPSRAFAEATTGRSGVDERVAGILRFGDLATSFHCGFTAQHQQVEAIGADGTLTVPAPFSDPWGLVVLNGEEHRVDPGNAYRAELEDFCAAIRGEHPPLLGKADALGQARALDALLRSAFTGEPAPV